MFPIPPPDRLIPRSLRSQSSAGRPTSLGEGILILGAFPLIFISAIAGAFLAGSFAGALWHWLAIPAGILGLIFGFALATTLLGHPTILCGVIEAAFYSYITFLFSGGRDRADPTPSWIFAGIVAAVFLGATFSAWKTNRN
jgi:cytochrome c biogenesis protein CcdA